MGVTRCFAAALVALTIAFPNSAAVAFPLLASVFGSRSAVAVATSLAIGSVPQISLRRLQGLDRKLHVYRQDESFLWRVQIQTHNGCGFGAEFRVCADAPTSSSLQTDVAPAQNPPETCALLTSPSFSASRPPFHCEYPLGGFSSSGASMRFSVDSSYLAGSPERAASCNPCRR